MNYKHVHLPQTQMRKYTFLITPSVTWESKRYKFIGRETDSLPGFFDDMMEWAVGGEFGGGFGGLVTRC